MKRLFYLLLFICYVLQSLNAQNVKEVTFSGGAPLDAYIPSITVPVLTEAFKRNGIEFKALHLPSLRSLESTNSGILDGELHRVSNFHEVSRGKYPNLIKIDSDLVHVWVVAFSTKNIKINSWKDLKDYYVSYYRGRKNITAALQNVVPQKQIFRVNNDKKAFELLAAGRIDIVVTERNQGNKILSGYPEFSSISEVGQLQQSIIYSYINKKYKDLARKIATSIDDMKKDGTFKRLFETINNHSK